MELLKLPTARLRVLREYHTFVNNTALTVYQRPPEHHMWFLINGVYTNGDDVVRSISVQLVRDFNDDLVSHLHWTTNQAAGASATFPTNVQNALQLSPVLYPLPIPRDKRIRYSWGAGGASTGGEGWVQIHVVEIETRDENKIRSEITI